MTSCLTAFNSIIINRVIEITKNSKNKFVFIETSVMMAGHVRKSPELKNVLKAPS